MKRAFCRTAFLLMFLAAGALLTAGKAAATSAKKSLCIHCHENVTPDIVKQFLSCRMSRNMDCSGCHGTAHTSASDADRARIPTPGTCSVCHAGRVRDYRKGKHSLAWKAAKTLPMITHHSCRGAEDSAGCPDCHRIGEKSKSEIIRYGSGACDSCHTRHSFSPAEARDPQACRTCHTGAGHPQWDMWESSRHGIILKTYSTTGRTPTCQTCHMPDGRHGVMTAWGFMALRLPGEDTEWMTNRVTILKAMGMLDEQGNPTGRMKAAEEIGFLRTDRGSFDEQRSRMVETCSGCHPRSYALEKLQEGDDVIREIDGILADSIKTVRALYDDGILKKPDNRRYAPDLLHPCETETDAEKELLLIFLEYRQRAFQSFFHSDPGYVQWLSRVKESAARIKEDADRLRRAHAK